MSRKNIRALFLALLAVLLIASACTPRQLAEQLTDTPTPAPTTAISPTPQPKDSDFAPLNVQRGDVAFSQMEYVRPTVEDVTALTDPFFEAFESAATAQEQIDLYVELDQALCRIGDMTTLARLNFYISVSEETQAENDYCSDFFADIRPITIKVCEALVNSPFQEEIIAYFGESVISDMRVEVERFVPEMAELDRQIDRLISEYTRIVNEHKNQLIAIEGQSFSSDDIFGAVLSLQDSGEKELAAYYEEYLLDYYDQRNELCDAIYTSMLELRTQQAQLAGFDSYPEYYFSTGSYTYEDVKDLLANIKTTFIPVAAQVYEGALEAAGPDGSPRLFAIASCPPMYMVEPTYYGYSDSPEVMEQKEYEAATHVLRQLSPQTSQLIDYLEEYELIDVFSSPDKGAGAFSTFFYGMQQPFVFSETMDLGTIIHESGHALNTFSYPQIDITERFDIGMEIAEVHSMALEMLAMDYYPQLYGESADYAVLSKLYECLSTILTQAMFCEFELTLYDYPDMTRQERAQLYSELRGEYYMDIPGFALYDTDGSNWVDVHHFFQAPLYTIDYSIAQIISFEIWNESLEDHPAALSTYMTFLQDNQEADLQRRLSNAGLHNPFELSLLETLAEQLRSFLTSSQYTDPMEVILTWMQPAA